MQDANGRKPDKQRKNIVALFKDEGLLIPIEINLQETEFLDVSLNPLNGKKSPYKKPNSNPLHIK